MNDNDWHDRLERISLHDSLSQQHNQDFRYQINPHEKQLSSQPFDPSVTLQYRDSVSSTASSFSTNTHYFSASSMYDSSFDTSHPPSRTPSYGSQRQMSLCSSPLSTSPVSSENTFGSRHSFSSVAHQMQDKPHHHSLIEPTGCFVPFKQLSFIQQPHVTRHHYVAATFAMTGQSQAEVMKLLFDTTDATPFATKEEYERTIPWQIDRNQSLVTLCQFTYLDEASDVSRNYLLGLGQRLGITSILVIVSMESFFTVYTLLDSLVKSMQTKVNTQPSSQAPSWWNRVVLIINQQHGANDQTAFVQRKRILVEDMQRIQERYRLSQSLSTLFLSTQTYDQIKLTDQGAHYKACCQRILWQMMARHTLSGRWCSEILSLQNRSNTVDSGNVALNILTEEDESDSSNEDTPFVTVIDYVDGKIKKPEKKKKQAAPKQSVQRRATRRQVQKLHCFDGDDGTIPPVPIRRF
ncbi:hypothetical protein BD560DRAFT_389792 [Blakeslea trispora]|nr:hypothetical protein BD560DRAFT_389792 [Blakeslea trispora]